MSTPSGGIPEDRDQTLDAREFEWLDAFPAEEPESPPSGEAPVTHAPMASDGASTPLTSIPQQVPEPVPAIAVRHVSALHLRARSDDGSRGDVHARDVAGAPLGVAPVMARDVAPPLTVAEPVSPKAARPSPSADSSAGANYVSLGDVHAREVTVQWSEAVAIVAELCSVLGKSGAFGVSVPDHGDVLLTSSGTIVVRPGGNRYHEISALGRMLHGLLATSTPPAPLRLFVSQSIAPDGFTSIAAFGEALAYYERPGRSEMIRAVYERCRVRPPVFVAAAPVVPVSPISIEEPPESPEPRRERPAAVPWMAILAAVVVGASASGLWLWMQPSGSSRSVPSTETATVETVDPLDPAGTGNGDEASGAVRSSERSGATASAARSRAPLVAGARPRGGVRVMVTPALPGDFAPDDLADSDSPANGTVDPRSIYSSANPDVDPPVILYTQLPEVAAPAAGPSNTNRMEVLVSAEGTVERVRLLTDPRRMTDMMLLSGAKTWRFEPARKDGQPVRYRAIVTWTVTPP